MKKQKPKLPGPQAIRQVEALKKVKVPLWARWLGEYRAWRADRIARKKVRLICTIKCWFQRTDFRKNVSVKVGFLHLYERGDGKRTYKYEAPHSDGGLPLKKTVVWNDYMVAWLAHQLDNKVMIEVADHFHSIPDARSTWG